MTPEQWRRIESIFQHVLDVPADERSAYLERACGSDAALRHQVESLLIADERPARVLDATPDEVAALLPEREPPIRQHVGPYRLLKEIGRGGMGAVYLAERADGQFSKQVAVKVVKRGMDTDEILRRFRYERQILAALEHRYIARLYDGGITDDGVPYLVMEYVEGQRITAYCDSKRLSVDERLALFQTVCEAVQYAHQNLVVHRDLKPSNILVTEDGQVKLLDFGIAKLLHEDADLSQPVTREGMRMLTPDYAAPEQVRGELITTATDVYALGLILYELLTGRRPHKAAGRQPSDVEKALLDTEPERPSTAVMKGTKYVSRGGRTEEMSPDQIGAARAASADRLRRRLRGDLDTIILKALKKDPARRYASAEAFLEDVKRHMAGLPVSARPDTPGYRFRKLVNRHRFGVAVAAAFFILVVGSAVTLALQQAETARQRDRAEQERDKAEETATFLTDLFNAADPYLATTDRLDTLRIRDVLDRGADKIRGEMQDRPALQAAMLDVVGNVYRNMGLYEKAASLLTQALELRRALHGDAHRDVAHSLYSLGKVLQAEGDYDGAEQHVRRALEIHRQENDKLAPTAAQMLAGMASVLRDQNNFDEAEGMLKEALIIQREHLGDEHLDVAASMLELGRVHQDRGNLVEAESLYRDVLGLHRKILGENHPDVAGSIENLATVLRQQSDLEAAEPLLREAITLRRRVLGAEHPHTLTSMYELAGMLRDKQDFEQAADLFKQVVDLDRRVLGDSHHYVGLALRELALTYLRMKSYDEALQTYHASLDILRRALPQDHGDIVHVMSGIGATYLQMAEYVRAERIFRDVLRIQIATLGENSWWTGISKSILGECLMHQRRYDQAEPLLVEGYVTVRDGNGPTEAALRRLVAFYEAVNDLPKSVKYQELLSPSSES